MLGVMSGVYKVYPGHQILIVAGFVYGSNQLVLLWILKGLKYLWSERNFCIDDANA